MKNRDKDFQKAFGKHVKKLREDKNWSQDQLATLANMEVNQISRIENGKHAANMHTIKAIALALGKYPDELLRFNFEHKLNTDFSSRLEKEKRTETTQIINKLVYADFLDSPRSVSQIVNECKVLYNVTLKSSATSGVLKKLIDAKKIKRIQSPKKGNAYLYQKRR